ncbi:hypothetical protein M7I_8177 [Glarea lozoyensis 74030]|uniref:Uncharacterized protein n=1 Tax=Glarea lozoyensis (strain ATCC 74030 / MF5533) TaxID=1104152 RepID=H0EZB4_GLAL7|nr:hypothetical protein M7I_8177 [Glarea lozoyensis 74030]
MEPTMSFVLKPQSFTANPMVMLDVIVRYNPYHILKDMKFPTSKSLMARTLKSTVVPKYRTLYKPFSKGKLRVPNYAVVPE